MEKGGGVGGGSEPHLLLNIILHSNSEPDNDSTELSVTPALVFSLSLF